MQAENKTATKFENLYRHLIHGVSESELKTPSKPLPPIQFPVRFMSTEPSGHDSLRSSAELSSCSTTTTRVAEVAKVDGEDGVRSCNGESSHNFERTAVADSDGRKEDFEFLSQTAETLSRARFPSLLRRLDADFESFTDRKREEIRNRAEEIRVKNPMALRGLFEGGRDGKRVRKSFETSSRVNSEPQASIVTLRDGQEVFELDIEPPQKPPQLVNEEIISQIDDEPSEYDRRTFHDDLLF